MWSSVHGVKDIFQQSPSNHKQELCRVQTITYTRKTIVYGKWYRVREQRIGKNKLEFFTIFYSFSGECLERRLNNDNYDLNPESRVYNAGKAECLSGVL